ncbi:hypothetical protein CAOG_002510 [Capsaspora owczarzaki ATCC 30864]|uniref:Uncharacterized protein n=1 Tax=Capsaspora owczarzaki (strain ATCC 30864) TaxID=595528 RepID=A0A0D2U8E2_CAPO3|nr:hypothetical protein CAOG_002510 [Capsaspora owczarzaki ATCC 30864]
MDDEEAEAAAAERRKYQARPKTSNWEKYDKTKMEMLLDDRLNLDLVGADYTSLLQAQAAVMLPEEAYFRFKDEQVAENQPTPADFDADAIALLSVNSHAVASALATLPLHVQLNIDSRYFERALLDDFELEAQSNLTKWNEAHPAPEVERSASCSCASCSSGRRRVNSTNS